jgi:hypothetical protein
VFLHGAFGVLPAREHMNFIGDLDHWTADSHVLMVLEAVRKHGRVEGYVASLRHLEGVKVECRAVCVNQTSHGARDIDF